MSSYDLRLWIAVRLAKDVDTCGELLLGHVVDEDRLDPAGLAWAAQMRFVRLDTTGIDVFLEEGL